MIRFQNPIQSKIKKEGKKENKKKERNGTTTTHRQFLKQQ